MNPLSKNFVRASLVYFFIAAIIGTIMIFMKSYPAQLLFTHVHLNQFSWDEKSGGCTTMLRSKCGLQMSGHGIASTNARSQI